jgi:predicted ATPase
MDSPLDKLTIRGFKSIQRLENFELGALNVLIGANGAGKSNFIEFFRLISAMMKRDGLKEYVSGRAPNYLYGGAKETPRIEVEMAFGKNSYGFQLKPTDDDFFVINDEWCSYLPIGCKTSLGSGNFNPGLLSAKDNPGRWTEKGIAGHAYEAICSWKIYHFHDTSEQAGMRRYQPESHYKDGNARPGLYTDASNIAAYLRWLKKTNPGVYCRIVDVVRLAIPFFDDFLLDVEDGEVRLEWRQKGLKNYPMRPTQFSDGSIRFICLATALLQPEPPSTIIIDEPELGLHPYAIALLAELIQTASSRTQVIVATQSQTLIDHFSIKDVIVVNRDQGASKFLRLNENDYRQWLEEYSLGELWSKNVLTGGPVYE